MENQKQQFTTKFDSLGEVLVPKNKYWGSVTQRSLNNFKVGDEMMPKEIISAYAIIKKSAAIANHTLGDLSDKKLEGIRLVCDEILCGDLDEHFPLTIWQTGSGTHTNMNVNEVISSRAKALKDIDIHPNDDVNMSQSSNDTFPTSIRISSYILTTEKLLPAIKTLKASFKKLSDNYMSITKSGRTHFMDAAPITLGQEFSAFYYMMEKTYTMILDSSNRLLELPLGGTAVGTGLNTRKGYQKLVAETIATETGYPFVSTENNFHGLTSMDCIVNLFGSIKALVSNLLKIANDIRILSSGPNTMVGEITIPANEPGSSIMPGKVNPTQIEALIMVCYQVTGYESAISLAASSGILQLNVSQPLIAYDTIKSIKLLSNAIMSFNDNCVIGIKPNEETIKKNLEKNLMMATSLNSIVGYDRCADIVKKAIKEKISIKESAMKLDLINEEDFDNTVNINDMCRPIDD